MAMGQNPQRRQSHHRMMVMFYKKLFFISLVVLTMLCSSYIHASSYHYNLPNLISKEEYHQRAKQYFVDKMFIERYLTDSEFKGNIKGFYYQYAQYHIDVESIFPLPDMSETERQSLLALFKVVTNNEQKAQRILEGFYQNHLAEYYKAKEACMESYCQFRSSIIIEDIHVAALGGVDQSGNYVAYLDVMTIYPASEKIKKAMGQTEQNPQ